MIPLLTSAWALAGLAAVPALVAIYLFQRRFRTRDVSSLLLWDAVWQASLGGRTREPLRLPLAFWLELVAIALIALAAAGPILPRWSRARPLVLVLDDSLSMSAGGANAPRERAMQAIREAASQGGHDPVHVVFAGATPQLAGGATLAEKLRGWTCNAPAADLDAAIGFATQVGGPTALVLVGTDHAPDATLEKGSLAWRAFGAPRANVAFAAAARSSGSRDRVLLEIVSYAKSPQERTLTLPGGRTMPIALRPGERKRLQFDAGGSGPFDARLSDDDAAYDDRVVLLAESRPPVRVSLRFANRDLRDDVEHALRATGRATVTDVRPELVVTDGAAPGAASGAAPNDGWSVVIGAAKAKSAVSGPYVLDRTHPLLRGLSFEGLIWGLPGGPVAQPSTQGAFVLVGNEVLLSDERVSGGHRVRMRLDPATSNVQRAPIWPAFWWNVVEWRSENAPGVRAANVILGNDARVKIDGARAVVTSPDGVRRELEAIDGELAIAATQTGVWKVQPQLTVDGWRLTGGTHTAATEPPTMTGGGPPSTVNHQPSTLRFAVNAIVPSESDLTRAASGEWGGWSEESLLSSGYQDVAWLLLLLALAVLVWHHWSLWSGAVQPAAGRSAS